MKLAHYIGDEMEVIVEYDFSAGQKEILYPNDKAQPGEEPEVTINGVFVGEADIYDVLSTDCIKQLEEAAMEHYSEQMEDAEHD